MSQLLRRRLTTSLAVLATALSSAIGAGVVAAAPASASSSTVWAGPDHNSYFDLDYNNCGNCGSYDEMGERFVAATSGPAAKVVLSTPYSTGALHVEIRSAENYPSVGGTLLASDVSSTVSLPGDWNSTTTFRMSGGQLSAGTTYVLLAEAQGAEANVGFYYSGNYDNANNFSYHYTYGGGSYWYDYGYYTMSATVYESDGADPPTVSAALSPATPNGSNGWYTTAPTVHFTCDDDLGVTDCPADYTVAEGGQDATSGTVHDENGNSADWSLPAVKVDTIAPSVSIGIDNDASSADGSYNANTGWYLGTPDFTGSCEDGATCTVEFDSSGYYGGPTTGGYGHWTRTAIDDAGNTTSASTGDVELNPTDPTISGTAVGLNSAGWANAGVHSGWDSNGNWSDTLPNSYIQWSCGSQFAGISSCGGANSQTGLTDETPVDGSDITGTVNDYSGRSATGSVHVKVDTTPPTLTPVITGTVGDNGWYTSPVTVSWTCEDALSGVKTCSNNTDTFADDEGTASGSATDVADNTASSSVDISSDTIAPLISGTILTDKGYGGVYDDPITVHWTCSETAAPGVSGVATCPADTTVTGIGTDTVASATVLDNAGNAAVGTVSHLFRRVDAPAITVTGALNGHTYDFGSTVAPSCTAISGSGDTVPCTGTVDGGTADGSGLFVYTATATDPITHLSSTKTVQWIVSERAAVSLVISGVTDDGSYAFGTPVHPTCVAMDADSKPVSCVTHTTGGDSDGSGQFTYRASATDAITGNISTARVSWTVGARPAPHIAIAGVIAGHVYAYGDKVQPSCEAVDATGKGVACDGVISSSKLVGGGMSYLYQVTASDTVTGALAMATASWSVAAQGKLAISGLPTKTKSGKPVLLAGKAYQISVSFSGSATSSAALAPYWLKPVKSNVAGGGKPTSITGTFAPAAKGSYTWTFTPTKAMRGTFRKFGVASPEGVMSYQTVYIK
jgi:hypothetical protein